jgi:hypothetical protein
VEGSRKRKSLCVPGIIGIYTVDLHPKHKKAPECTFPLACLPASKDARMHLSGMFTGKKSFIFI